MAHTINPEELNIVGATILSLEEYRKYMDIIDKLPHNCDDWWLRTACVEYGNNAGYIVHQNTVVPEFVFNANIVRPALKIANIDKTVYEVGDSFWFKDGIFTIISRDLALCDTCIGHCAFQSYTKAEDANNYEKSDLKIFLEEWAKGNNL